MQIYPAIDLKGGRVVRLLEGETVRETEYGDDPLGQAMAYVQAGASWIHVVDMDRAFHTGDDNIDWVRQIAAIQQVRIQVGGNVDTEAWAHDAVGSGASRVVLGTSAALDPAMFRSVVDIAGADKCALAIDTRNGRPALRQSDQTVDESVSDLVTRAVDFGVEVIVYRDLARDGLVMGADIEGASRIADLGAEVIVAGGVAGLDDIREAARAGLAGVIVGRALYDERFTLEEAIACSS